jgi:hypothetical protein
MAAKQQKGMMAPAAKFVASLIFLYVVFGPLNAAYAAPTGNFWASLLYAAAVLGSITLFFASIAGFSSMVPKMCDCKALKITPFALLAWVAITAPFSTTNLVLVVIGAVLCGLGSMCC